MADGLDADAARLLARVNELRAGAAREADELAALEARVDGRWSASQRLVSYGSLAPGAPNHHELAALTGTWSEGFVRGELRASGWGAELGFPALRPDEDGPDVVPARLFASPDLPAHWPRLDAFEGGGYRRLLVPVRAGGADGEVVAVGNLYAEAAP